MFPFFGILAVWRKVYRTVSLINDDDRDGMPGMLFPPHYIGMIFFLSFSLSFLSLPTGKQLFRLHSLLLLVDFFCYFVVLLVCVSFLLIRQKQKKTFSSNQMMHWEAKRVPLSILSSLLLLLFLVCVSFQPVTPVPSFLSISIYRYIVLVLVVWNMISILLLLLLFESLLLLLLLLFLLFSACYCRSPSSTTDTRTHRTSYTEYTPTCIHAFIHSYSHTYTHPLYPVNRHTYNNTQYVHTQIE